jgi:hypothetical protein
MDLDLNDGLEITSGQSFAIYGVVRQIPSQVKEGEHAREYEILNRIGTIRYKITASDDSLIGRWEKDVDLQRMYDPQDPGWLSHSVYEFKHCFTLGNGAGTYRVQLQGLDLDGKVILGTTESFPVYVR